MENASIDETRPTSVNQESQSDQQTQPTAGSQPATGDPSTQAQTRAEDGSQGNPEGHSYGWRWMILLGVLTLIVIAGMSAFGGYRAGMFQRNNARDTQVASELSQQYELALQDMNAKHYDLARQRFEFIVRQDPGFPNVTEKLAEVLLQMNITATPTLAPTPTLTPTADLRSVEELYAQAKQSLAGGDWTPAIDALLKLRKDSPSYHAVELDGMLYVALRNRGIDKIKKHDLEGGTYDLALAERFGPLDVEATSYRSWADLYSTGASYWDVDWQKAVEIFAQLWRAAPYLSDSSNWTSTDRYRIALTKYGDQLAQSGDWCLAEKQYRASLEINNDPQVQPTATYAGEQCSSGATNEKPNKKTPEATSVPEGQTTPTQPSQPATPYP